MPTKPPSTPDLLLDLAEALATFDGDREQRSGFPDYLADAALLIELLGEHRLQVVPLKARTTGSATAPEPPITGAQVRRAREHLGMSRDELARAAGVYKDTLRSFETSGRRPTLATARAVKRALEEAGASFSAEEDD